jgi:hypothetical protein
MNHGLARNGKDHRVRRQVRGSSNGEETIAQVAGLGCLMLAEPAESVWSPCVDCGVVCLRVKVASAINEKAQHLTLDT